MTVGLTADFLTPDGELPYRDIGLGRLQAEPRIKYHFMPPHPLLLEAHHIQDYDAIVSLAPKYTRETFSGADRLTLIARFGVGYDVVDVRACTEADVALCTTRGAVDHSMGESIIAWMLALSYRVFEKDRLLRTSGWSQKIRYMGSEVRGKQLGVIGLGGIGRRLVEKVRSLALAPVIVHDPYLSPQTAASHDVSLVGLEELLQRSDFVAVCCPLTPETRNLLNERTLQMMKPGAYLINVARGGIVEEAPLIELLRTRHLAGAAIDVFSVQPAGSDHPLAGMDNVILAPHCIGWTDEMFAEIGRMACSEVVRVAHGLVPQFLVNPEVVQRPGFQRKLARFQDPSTPQLHPPCNSTPA